MNKCKVHRIRFFEPNSLTSINCIALNERTKKLALLRKAISKNTADRAVSASTVEIWNCSTEDAPFLESVVPENDDSPGLLESVAWGQNNRLFSCGLNGNFNEYDLNRNCIKKSYVAGTGGVWCMSFNKAGDRVILGTEEGTLSLFNLDSSQGDDVNFEKIIGKWSARILSIAWYESSGINRVVTGSLDFIAIWNFESGRCLDRMRVGTNTMVWCVDVLPNFIIVSGDSSGATTFWDGNMATLKHRFQSHKADVLCLCKGKEDNIYSAGVDPTIAQFKVIVGGKIVKVPNYNNHTHDVRTLRSSSSGWLYSGGMDSYLMKSIALPTKNVLRYSQNLTRLIHCSQRLLLLQDTNSLSLWQFHEGGNSLSDLSYCGDDLNPTKLATLTSKRNLTASNVSENWIAYSHHKGLVVLHRTPSKLVKVHFTGETVVGVIDRLEFFGDSHLCASNGLFLYVMCLNQGGITLAKKFKFKKRIHIHKLWRGYLIVVLSNGLMQVYNMQDWQLANTLELSALPIAVEGNPFYPKEVWLAMSNKSLIHYDLPSHSVRNSHSLSHTEKFEAFRGLCFTKDSVVAYDQDKFYSMNAGTGKMRTINASYRHIVKMGNLDDGHELYVVECTPEILFKRLPSAFMKKRFHT